MRTFVDFHYSKFHEAFPSFHPWSASLAPSSPLRLDPTPAHLDCYDHFFDTYTHAAEMEGDATVLDFFDANLATDLDPTALVPHDPFAFDTLCDAHHHLHCTFLSDDIFTDPPAPTPLAYNAAIMGRVDLYQPHPPSSFPVIFDTGASLAISPSKDDFAGTITPFDTPQRLGGMANGMNIEGVGIIKWSFRTTHGILTIHSRCYYVPDSKARLISPQRLFRKSEGVVGRFITAEDSCTLEFDNVGSLDIPYDSRSHLPIALGKNLAIDGGPQANICILNEANQNLTPSQRLLLTWHARFGHKNFQAIQRLFRQIPFLGDKFQSASRCEIPRCEVCEYSKAHRKPTKGHIHKSDERFNGHLKAGDLRPGASVSADHFESRIKGRTLTSFGRPTSDQYVGGCIFVDHMSGYIHVEHQVGFSSIETIRAKQNFEKLALDNGVLIDSYLTDNGIFKANAFVSHIRNQHQKLRFCGVNAHHKNAIAERAIRTVSDCARALLLHSSLRWKSGIDSSLWPLAVRYATHLYNHLPNERGIAPADLFTGSTVPRYKLKNYHVWGAPVYVLDPVLQGGKKLPRWQPKSRRGVFVGFSDAHSSDVPLVLNLQTGHISPQFHVVFDDAFSTVASLGEEEPVPPFWNEFDLDDYIHRIPLDKDASPQLEDHWLTPSERDAKQRATNRSMHIQSAMDRTVTSKSTTPTPSALPTDVPSAPTTSPSAIPSQTQVLSPSQSTEQVPAAPSNPPAPAPSNSPAPAPSSSPAPAPTAARRSSRPNKGVFTNRYVPASFLTAITNTSHSKYCQDLIYSAELHTDLDYNICNAPDPRAFLAKHKQTTNPDLPSYHEALTGPYSQEYEKAMITEITQLIKQNTWTSMPRSSVPLGPDSRRRPILKGTWAFKLKRHPDGTPYKFKARYCVRGDLQREGIDFFETYAPVVQWSTVRLLLTLVLANQWTTKQVDYTNAFAQAAIQEEVYIEPPRGFGRSDGKDMILKLNKSLYGLRQAPKTFFDKLKDGLLERGFIQSDHDPCLFLKDNMICVVYVDDTIIAGPDSDAIESLITDLGVAKDEHRHTFELRDEGEVGDFLGIRIGKMDNTSFHLSQTGLISKILKESNMENANSCKTPASPTPLHLDSEGEPFNESWDYASIVGMLMYLAGNSRPDIAYAVHQCARFTHCPRNSHAIGIKRIIRYLQGTKEKGLIMKPTPGLKVNCYVDADFAGLWKVENPQDPISVKSRSGHLIMFMDCPLLWTSKLQTQIALSTMEAEYIALSNSMRDLISIRAILKEIISTVKLPSSYQKETSIRTISKTFTPSLPQSTVYEDNEACLKFASMPKMTPRTKHIAIPYHFFRQKVKDLEIKVVSINTEHQLADQFTKGLSEDKFVQARKYLMGW